MTKIYVAMELWTTGNLRISDHIVGTLTLPGFSGALIGFNTMNKCLNAIDAQGRGGHSYIAMEFQAISGV